MWRHIKEHEFITRNVWVNFQVLLPVSDVRAEKQDTSTSKCPDNNPFNMRLNENERPQWNENSIHFKERYWLNLWVTFSWFQFVFIS